MNIKNRITASTSLYNFGEAAETHKLEIAQSVRDANGDAEEAMHFQELILKEVKRMAEELELTGYEIMKIKLTAYVGVLDENQDHF